MRFSNDEVHMYAQWFSADVPLVRALVVECSGDRGLILASLQEHQRQQQLASPSTANASSSPTHSPSPPLLRRRSSGRRDSSHGHDGGALASPLPPRPPSEQEGRSRRLTSGASSAHETSQRRTTQRSTSAHKSRDAEPVALPPPGALPLLLDDATFPETSYSIGSIFRVADDCADQDSEDDAERDKLVGSKRSASSRAQRLTLLILQPLAKEEQSMRRLLEEKERADALRMWRSSMVCAVQVAATESHALIASEAMHRKILAANEQRQWGPLNAAAIICAAELRSRSELCQQAVHLFCSNFGDVIDSLHSAGRAALVRAERQQRDHLTDVVFMAGLRLAQIVRQASQVRSEIWHERQLWLHLTTHRMASAERLIYEKFALATWMVRHEEHFRNQIVSYEAGYRALLADLAKHTHQLGVAYVEEPWERRRLGDAEAVEYHKLRQLCSWAVKTSIPFCYTEQRERDRVCAQEADDAGTLQLTIQYHEIMLRQKIRSIAQQQSDVRRQQQQPMRRATSAELGLWTRLLMELEDGRRNRIERQYQLMVQFLLAQKVSS